MFLLLLEKNPVSQWLFRTFTFFGSETGDGGNPANLQAPIQITSFHLMIGLNSKHNRLLDKKYHR